MNILSKPKTACIFDVDGTLVKTEKMYAQIMVAHLNSLGIELNEQDYMAQFSGKSFDTVLKHINQILISQNKQPLDIALTIQILDAKIKKHITENGIDRTVGSIELLQDLNSKRIQKAIGSNAPYAGILDNLDASQQEQYFNENHIFSAYDLGSWKPNPAVFQAAYHSLDTTNVTTVFIFEDSMSGMLAIEGFQNQNPDLDVRGVFVDNGDNSHLRSHTPDIIKYHISDLQEARILIEN